MNGPVDEKTASGHSSTMAQEVTESKSEPKRTTVTNRDELIQSVFNLHRGGGGNAA